MTTDEGLRWKKLQCRARWSPAAGQSFEHHSPPDRCPDQLRDLPVKAGCLENNLCSKYVLEDHSHDPMWSWCSQGPAECTLERGHEDILDQQSYIQPGDEGAQLFSQLRHGLGLRRLVLQRLWFSFPVLGSLPL